MGWVEVRRSGRATTGGGCRADGGRARVRPMKVQHPPTAHQPSTSLEVTDRTGRIPTRDASVASVGRVRQFMSAVRSRESGGLLAGRYPRNLAGPFRDNHTFLAAVRLARGLPHLSPVRVDARVLA